LALTAGGAHSLELARTDARLLEALLRLLHTVLDPTDSLVLLPQILREAHFRLLQSDHGGMLRTLSRYDSHENGIARAISIIRGSFKEALSVPDLAKQVGMSTSSFYQHFKVITDSTPLQYQKDLRLLEAQRLLTAEGLSVTSTAFEIGYESPSQFSREYVRKFGSTPSADLKQTIKALNMRRS
jgi:AraC-like DNA-binding protein